MDKKRVLLAMSGGTDSSVAALLLKEQGHEVVGITFRTWDSIPSAFTEKEKGSFSADAIVNAQEFAREINIEHHIIDLRQTFRETVIRDFTDEYLAGRTPNPCILCNKIIKWGKLMEQVSAFGCDYLATGHYAGIKQENNRYFLKKGADETKDQSYFLWMLTQENLERTIFPLGGYHKEKIKKIAVQKGFSHLGNRKESQEICFIPDDDYRGFLKEQKPDIEKILNGGDFVSTDGKVLGKHKGYPFYTIGQRKGLEVAVGYPLYVTRIDPQNNTVTLGKREEIENTSMLVQNINLMKYPELKAGKEAEIKVRYRNQGEKGKIYPQADGIRVEFEHGVFAITPGQSAVFYEGDEVLGGGIIT